MAINLLTEYPGKVAAASAGFPFGSARNVTTPGDGTGTPWEQAIVNDLVGWQQALLSRVGATPTGTPDEVGASQYLDAIEEIIRLEVIDDLSQAYEFATIAAFKASTIAFAVGKPLYIRELTIGNGGGEIYYIALTSTVTPDDIDVFQSTAVPTQSAVKAEYGQVSGDADKKYIKVAGVIRNTGTGWFFISDSGHNKITFGTITTDIAGTVTIQNPPNVKTIGSVLVGADETFSKIGITAGSSVSLAETVITFAAPLEFILNADAATVSVPAHFTDQITAQVNASNIAINYPAQQTNVPILMSRIGSDPIEKINASLSVAGSTTSQIQFRKDFYGFVFWDGAAWDTLGSNDDAGAVTFAFAASKLTITHPNTAGEFNRQITGRHPYHALIGSITDTTTDVHFVTLPGVDVTPEDTNMRFTYLIGEMPCVVGASVITKIGQWAIKGGNCQVDANEIVEANGNFWIEGIFEI